MSDARDSFVIESLDEIPWITPPYEGVTHRGRARVYEPVSGRMYGYECWFTEAFIEDDANRSVETLEQVARQALAKTLRGQQ